MIKVCAENNSMSCFSVLQQSDNDVLKFESLVLLHEMVSQVAILFHLKADLFFTLNT